MEHSQQWTRPYKSNGWMYNLQIAFYVSAAVFCMQFLHMALQAASSQE